MLNVFPPRRRRVSWGALLMAAFLLLLVSPADGRRHLIRHGRQRRQHQHQHHHFQQNVTLGLNPGSYHESGPWGPWTASSSCSRTCGGGVAYQTRVCEELRADGTHGCVGPFKRYFSCNIEECPDYTKDFREEQCARFNSIAFKGRYYSWVPYYKAVNPCELNCRPIGERFYYRHSPKTIDGTRCHDDGSLDVCINRACMPVGCDKMLGSDAVEDKCRKCRGYGTSCSTFEGVFDLDNLEVGYNDILLIPTGATNIRIEEKFPTNNYLAVRNKTGYYYLNGNWRIEFPRSIRFAGTVFHYERQNHGANAPDSLFALGPTTETILIVLLYQEKNLGITYEYSVPVGVSQPQPGTYNWNSGDFGECSQACGGGMQSRLVYCSNAVTSERVSDDLCNPTIKPQATKVCNPEPCPASWYVGEWEKCSKTCGNGIQFRLVFCQYETERGTMLADDSDCLSSVGPKPERLRECSSEAECASWEAGNWTECDRLCGEGTQVRDVQCIYPLEGNAVEVLDDLGCDQSTKPATNRTCEIRPCDGTEWVTSPWSGCDTPCSSQIETRDVLCVLEDGTLLPDEYCDEEKRPNATKPCDEDVGALDSQCLYMWYYSPWSPCSTECGRGLKTRKVFCGTLSEGNIQNVTDDLCNPDDQLPSTEECVIEAVCNGTWITAPWNRCSTPCGGGQRTRIIVCHVNGKPAAPKNCDAGKRPFDSESCNMDACDDDLCILPKAPGSCSGQIVHWFYDPETDQCHEFAYSGCQGNANRFNDRESCEHRCRKETPLLAKQPTDRVTSLDACAQPKQPGPCYGVLPMWYYDAYARECRNFTYGGCEGNDNRFDSRELCEQRCTNFVPPAMVCKMMVDPGRCEKMHARWFYDVKTGRCLHFVYTGCEGNKNRFRTREICMKFCQGVTMDSPDSQLDEDKARMVPGAPPTRTEPPISGEELNPRIKPAMSVTPVPKEVQAMKPLPRPTAAQECLPSNCEELQCPLGKNQTVDHLGCVQCRCSNPCETFSCREEELCRLEAYWSADGRPNFRPICRLVSKPGHCPEAEVEAQPAAVVRADCRDVCRVDADCPDVRKCCYNGCAHVCVSAMVTALTTPHHQPPQSHGRDRNGGDHSEAVQAKPEVTANAGSGVTLPCLDGPFPIVHVSWTFRDESVESNEGRFKILVDHSLYISQLSADDAGPYRCTANDGHHTVSHVTNLVVYVPATIRPSDDLVSVRVSETARLACVAVGFPRPFVQWYRGGKQLPRSARYATRGDFTLVIRNVTLEDEGIYMCRAYNYHGDPAVWKVSLSVLPPYPAPSRSAWRRRRRGHHSSRDTSEGLWRRGRKVYQSVRKVPQKGRGKRGGRRKFGKRG